MMNPVITASYTRLGVLSLLFLFSINLAQAQTTAFAYQGKLSNAGSPANGSFDLQFKLFDAGGTQVGPTFTNPSVTVTNGVFTVQLDFGAVFDGSARYLEIGVRPAGCVPPNCAAYAILSPRQPITSTPYAVRSANSAAADGLSAACVNCVLSNQIQSVDGAQVTGAIPVESVPVGSNNYIQNTASLPPARRTGGGQPGTSFNIDGDGIIGGSLTIGAQFPLGRLRVHDPGNVAAMYLSTGSGTEGPATFRLQADSGLLGQGRSFVLFDDFAAKYRLVVNGAGNIGFGITTPLGNLHAHSEGPTSNLVLSTTSGSEGAARFRLQADSGIAGQGKSFVVVDDLAVQYRMMINGAGNVGFGTVNPLGRLHAHSNGAFTPLVLSTGSGSEGPARFKIQADSGLLGQGKSLVIYDDIAAQYRVVINGSGNIGVGTTTPAAKLHVVGTARTSVLEITGGSDLAEHFELAEDAQPGLVVAIDPQRAGKLALARGAYNRRVAGIISGANNLSAGMVLPDAAGARDSRPVALSGRVWVYCDASKHPIKPGDLLTTSNIPGHAMKVTNYTKAQGAILGKATTGLNRGKGLVLVLVTLQ